MRVYDTMEGAGGFDEIGRDVTMPRSSNTPVPAWGLNKNVSRYYPASIDNVRKDLIEWKFRTPLPDHDDHDHASQSRGIGLSGKEGLPFWMTCEQRPGFPSSVIGYVPAIELAYLKPGQGAQAVKTMVQAGFESNLRGKVIPIDRYLLSSDGLTMTTFDFDPASNTETTFDGPENIFDPTSDFTTFDMALEPKSKYFKFPPGDVNNY